MDQSWLLMQAAELLRIYIEVEGMKAENQHWLSVGQPVTYSEEQFQQKAAETQFVYNRIHESR